MYCSRQHLNLITKPHSSILQTATSSPTFRPLTTRVRTGSSTSLARARVSQDSRTPRGPASNRLPLDSKTRTLHILNLPGQFPHCNITCWHTPSFPGKASQETGTLALAGPIQPAPRYMALTLIPRDELLPHQELSSSGPRRMCKAQLLSRAPYQEITPCSNIVRPGAHYSKGDVTWNFRT